MPHVAVADQVWKTDEAFGRLLVPTGIHLFNSWENNATLCTTVSSLVLDLVFETAAYCETWGYVMTPAQTLQQWENNHHYFTTAPKK